MPESRLPERTTTDGAIEIGQAVVRGAFAIVPVIGPAISELIGVAWAEVKWDRLERVAESLADRMDRLEQAQAIDREFAKTPEFAATFEEVMDRIAQGRSDDKVSAFASAIAASASTSRPSKDDRERFLDDLDALRLRHLVALQRLATAEPLPVGEPDPMRPFGPFDERLRVAIVGLEADLTDLGELERRGHLRPLDNNSTQMLASEDIRALVTRRGRAFLEFITAGTEAAPGHTRPVLTELARAGWVTRQGHPNDASRDPDGTYHFEVTPLGSGRTFSADGETNDAIRRVLAEMEGAGYDVP